MFVVFAFHIYSFKNTGETKKTSHISSFRWGT